MFTHLNTVVLYVSNIEKSKYFYTSLLGFTVDYEDGNYIALKVTLDDKTSIAINSDTLYKDLRGKQTIIVRTKDIHQSYNHLKKSVTIITDLYTAPWGNTFTLQDLDGNRIEILE